MKTHLIAFVALAFISAASPAATWSQRPDASDSPDAGITPVELVDSPAAPVPRFDSRSTQSSVQNGRMSTAELRQARALYRAQQRTARLEYNLWMGVEPLRPNWNSVPMMSSRYRNQRIYVPAYFYAR